MIKKFTLLLLGIVIGTAATLGVVSTGTRSGAQAAAGAEAFNQLRLFGDVFERVLNDYVEEPSEEALVESAINGMLTSLDPHSSYMPPDEFRAMRTQTSGQFGGLGIQVTMEDGLVKVVSPIDETPAARAGLLTNDLITHLDGEPIAGLSLQEAVDKMRGPVGTDIRLTIQRGENEPFDVTLTRDIVRIASVRHRIEGDIGYVRITQFSEQTMSGLEESLRAIRDAVPAGTLKGFVIDLRNNPGGLLTQALEVSDAFLERGEIVSTRGRQAAETRRYNARAGDLTDGLPVVVLVNGGSASASEIVAGALQDLRRATIVGTRSFGKGSVQTVIPIASDSAIRLTTALYYTPSGRSIQATGIVPDIIIEQENLPEDLVGRDSSGGEAGLRGHFGAQNGVEAGGSSVYVPQDQTLDTQLIYAYQLIRGEVQNAAFPPDPSAPVPN